MNSAVDQTSWYRSLGPIQVQRGETTLDLGPRQRRLLLTHLLVVEGRPVPVGELCQSLWPHGRVPAGALSSIRAHVSRLRSVLDPRRQGASTVLVAGTSAYSLHVPREARDSTAFEDLLNSARGAVKHGRLTLAGRRLDEALALWRGDAFQEAAGHGFATRARARLHGMLQETRELRTTVLLKQGDVERAVEMAESLAAGAPMREGSWELLMRALYEGGRPAEALRQYERFRRMLADEVGLDPSPALSRLHVAILRHDSEFLDGFRASPADTSPADLVPATTPLVGRAEETAELAAVLATAATGRTTWAVISGEPGSGKTRLLDEAAVRAGASGFTVARVDGGQAPGPNGEGPRSSPAARLLEALRQGRPPESAAGGGSGTMLETLVRALSRRPVLCVIDDLDSAPPEFHSLLTQLVDAVPEGHIAVLLAVRTADDPLSDGLLTALARRGATWLPLEPLTAREVSEVLALRGETTTQEDATLLWWRSGGNPFTLGELLKLPPDRRTGPLARVPTAVRGRVLSRLAELPDPVRALLTYAAVDGEWLDIGVLAEIQDEPLNELLPLVDTAVAARLLTWEETGPDETAVSGYRFPELPREVVLGTLPPSSRQFLHATLARHLTARDGVDPARLARHVRAAGAVAAAAESS
ncbi:BTAD domain-containing putative transcriptional regulator [Streptomyces sp. NPDC006645]|uniref:BTAD domain-containing putative transcriptional regulator n=1 Tax=unclassified Streptomyces TaxID=2593676 RepID=UPI0033AB768B